MRPTLERIHSAQTWPLKPSLCAGLEVLIKANSGQAPSFSSPLPLFTISLAFVKHLRILTLVTTTIRWTCETLQPEFKKNKMGETEKLLLPPYDLVPLKKISEKAVGHYYFIAGNRLPAVQALMWESSCCYSVITRVSPPQYLSGVCLRCVSKTFLKHTYVPKKEKKKYKNVTGPVPSLHQPGKSLTGYQRSAIARILFSRRAGVTTFLWHKGTSSRGWQTQTWLEYSINLPLFC